MELLQNKLKTTSRVYSVALLIFALYYVYAAANYIYTQFWLSSAQNAALMNARLTAAGFENQSLFWWRGFLVLAFFNTAVCAAAEFYGFSAFRGIADTGEPFSPTVVRKLKMMVWLMAASVLLTAAIGYLAASVSPTLMGNTHMATISLTATGVIDVLSFFALVSIFQYGARLQQLSDETL